MAKVIDRSPQAGTEAAQLGGQAADTGAKR
jgi:hypothetical protein